MGVTDVAIERIREQISSGALGPGSKLPPEAELAKALGVSRSSVREAVKALVHARVLDVRQGDGTYVTSLEPRLLLDGLSLAVELIQDHQLLEVMEVRRLLEPGATALAASRISPADLEVLRDRLDLMRACASDAEKLVEHDASFHDRVMAATGNQTLESVLRGLSTATMRARIWRAAVESGAAANTVAQHEDIYRALASGDSRLAEAAALVHVVTSEAWLREQLARSVVPNGAQGTRAAGRRPRRAPASAGTRRRVTSDERRSEQ
jgi:GntR family transcriptional repressor for pyruvate dehydrogenase complex